MAAAPARPNVTARSRLVFVFAIICLAALRLAHVRLLWADEDYHLAAALSILRGKLPYRDFWYDKPPLSALYYLLAGARPGWPLRLLDMLYVLLACWLMYRLAKLWWGPPEGWLAALLLAFFFAFYLPSAVISFAPDALLLAPQLAVLYFALARRPVLAGLCCVLAFLINAKALFVLAVAALWFPSALPLLMLGFLAPLLLLVPVALASGCWSGYVEQVWRWGWLYAQGSPVAHPVQLGLRRTLDWLGFHAVLLLGAVCAFRLGSARDRWRLGTWLAVSFAAVSLGTRWAPHYFLQLLPAAVVCAARGLLLLWEHSRAQTRPRWLAAAALLLLVPLIRFGPRYVSLTVDNLRGRDPRWSDVALDLDSQRAAAIVRQSARPGDTLFVWGYRPDLYVYTGLVSDGLFWDSQPLTGVPADRHLHETTAIYPAPATARNRAAFARTRPTFLVDGLSTMNPALPPGRYPELQPWLTHYRLIGRTKLCLVYRRLD